MTNQEKYKEELQEIRKKIEETPVFDLDKEKDKNKYKIETMKLVENLYLYVIKKYKYNHTLLFEANYEEYAVEIVELASHCIKKYDKNHKKGSTFLNFFIKSFEMEFKRIRGDIAISTTKGSISIPERDRKLLKRLECYLKEKDNVLSPTIHEELVSKLFNITNEKARDIIYLHYLKPDSIEVNDEGEEIMTIDNIDDGKPLIEHYIIEEENWNEIMKKIEYEFNQLHSKSRQQYVIDLLTCDIAGIILAMDKEDYSYDYSFINQELMHKILETREIPKGKDIAVNYQKSQATISRAYSNVLNKMKKAMQTDKEDIFLK